MLSIGESQSVSKWSMQGGAQVQDECTGTHWYAIYTNSHHEKRVERQLQQRGIECFLATYKSVRRWKDRRKELQLPLFPGYVFVCLPLKERVQVLQLAGVVEFVSRAGLPVPLVDSEIDSLRNGLHYAVAQPHPYLRAGRRVRVHSGPIAGVEGILLRRKDKLRVVISIHLIQRSMAVEVDEDTIEPLR